jgi:CBS domain containing-hemolysin-like protein
VRPIFKRIWENEFHSLSNRQKAYIDKIKGLSASTLDVNQTLFLCKTIFNMLLLVFTPLLFFPELYAEPRILSWCIYLVAAVFTLTIFLHILPMAFARSCANRFWAYFLTYNIYIFFARLLLVIPFVPALNLIEKSFYKLLGYEERYKFLSDEERGKILEPTESSSDLEKDEKEMIHSIFELGDTEVKEIMVPRIDMFALDISSSLEEILNAFNQESHSRIPVFKENIDNIQGILYGKDILKFLDNHDKSEWDLGKNLREPYYVPENKKIDDLLREFKRDKNHIAIVADQYGGTAGLVTMEDILEEIVGEIQDEHDTEDVLVRKINEQTWEVDPKINIEELGEMLEVELDEGDNGDFDTLSGLIFTLAAAIPESGQEFSFAGLRMKVLAMDGQRIERVKIIKPEQKKEENS